MQIITQKMIIFLMLPFTLLSCGGGGGGSNGSNTGSTEQKQFVLDVMRDYYLYYDQLPSTVDINAYDSAEAMLAALTIPSDRFSYIADQAAQSNFFEEGTYQGLGFFQQAVTNTVIYVFDDSAAGRSDIQRGDIIVSSSRVGNTITLDINRQGARIVRVLDVGLVRMNTVLTTDIQNHNGVDIGYLALSSFIEPTKNELATTFTTFAQADIDELVLDLRYNGGGRVTTAQELASYIVGINGIDSDVARLEWNDKHTRQNQAFDFLSLTNSLNLNRLYVLTLPGTCSASELVINAMAGINVDVITIGDTTCGKPVGSVGFNFADKTLNPITFDVVNELGNGEYFDGIDPICLATDDTSHPFADPMETMYAAALYHISNSTCETPATRSALSANRQTTLYNPDPMANLR